MKNMEQKENFLDRHINNLPQKKCVIKIIHQDINGEQVYLCEWRPFDKSQYQANNMPSEGYLGTAKVIEGKYTGIGFHAWKQNNSEFVLYSIV